VGAKPRLVLKEQNILFDSSKHRFDCIRKTGVARKPIQLPDFWNGKPFTPASVMRCATGAITPICGAPYGTAQFKLNQSLGEKWDTESFHGIIMFLIPSVPPNSSSKHLLRQTILGAPFFTISRISRPETAGGRYPRKEEFAKDRAVLLPQHNQKRTRLFNEFHA
jgi:hypothetical protein